MYNRTLVSDPLITIHLTRVTNQTSSLEEGDEHVFSAIWISTVLNQLEKIFFDWEQYIYYDLTRPTVMVTLTESNYYILNIEDPIAKKFEVISQDLVFTVVCLENFGLLFLIIKIIHRHLLKRKSTIDPIKETGVEDCD